MGGERVTENTFAREAIQARAWKRIWTGGSVTSKKVDILDAQDDLLALVLALGGIKYQLVAGTKGGSPGTGHAIITQLGGGMGTFKPSQNHEKKKQEKTCIKRRKVKNLQNSFVLLPLIPELQFQKLHVRLNGMYFTRQPIAVTNMEYSACLR